MDNRLEATGGFSEKYKDYKLEVNFPDEWLGLVVEEKREALIEVLAQDPRPSYQNVPERIYGMEFAEYEVKFRVNSKQLNVSKVELRTQRD